MFPAPLLLILLIVTAPALVIFDGPVVRGLVTATAAVSVAIVAVRIRPGEIGFLSTVIRPMVIIAALPAVWMLLQIQPLTMVGLAHPIWESAGTTLGRPLLGSITVDPGATLIALARYFSIVAIIFVAAAVATNRKHAEWVLLALTASTTLIALIVLIGGLYDLYLPKSPEVDLAFGPAIDCAGLGIIIAVAAAFHTFERGTIQRIDQSGSGLRYWLVALLSLVAAATCSLAVFKNAASQTFFAVGCGIATLAVAVLIRRFLLGPWGVSAIVAVALVLSGATVAFQPGNRPIDLTLMFASRAPPPLIAVTQRILAETKWVGTGAGTFDAMLPVYGNIDELAAGRAAPTAAAAVAVEMGRPFLWIILIAAIVLVITFLRGAVLRRRDSFYATAGAASVVTAALLSFGNAGLFSTPVSIIAAATIGIAIAQRKSRSIA